MWNVVDTIYVRIDRATAVGKSAVFFYDGKSLEYIKSFVL